MLARLPVGRGAQRRTGAARQAHRAKHTRFREPSVLAPAAGACAGAGCRRPSWRAARCCCGSAASCLPGPSPAHWTPCSAACSRSAPVLFLCFFCLFFFVFSSSMSFFFLGRFSACGPTCPPQRAQNRAELGRMHRAARSVRAAHPALFRPACTRGTLFCCFKAGASPPPPTPPPLLATGAHGGGGGAAPHAAGRGAAAVAHAAAARRSAGAGADGAAAGGAGRGAWLAVRLLAV